MFNQNREMEAPSREEFQDWKHNNRCTQYYEAYLTELLKRHVEEFLEGSLIEGETSEEIAVYNIKAATRTALLKELLELDYNDIKEVL